MEVTAGPKVNRVPLQVAFRVLCTWYSVLRRLPKPQHTSAVLRWRLISAAVILAVAADARLARLSASCVARRAARGCCPFCWSCQLLATGEVLSLLGGQRTTAPSPRSSTLGNAADPAGGGAAAGLFNSAGHRLADVTPLGDFGWPLVALAAGSHRRADRRNGPLSSGRERRSSMRHWASSRWSMSDCWAASWRRCGCFMTTTGD